MTSHDMTLARSHVYLGTTGRLAAMTRGRGTGVRLSGGGFKYIPAVGIIAGMASVNSLAGNLEDFARNRAKGDETEAFFDLLGAAIDIQNLGGNYFATVGFLGMVMELE